MTSYFHDAFNSCNRLVYCDSAAIYRQQLLYEQQHQQEAQRGRLTDLQSRRDTGHRICQSLTGGDDVTNTPLDARSDDVTTSGGSPMTGRQLFPIQRHHPLDWSTAAAMMECSRLRHQMTSPATHHQHCPSTPVMDVSTMPSSTFYRTLTSSSVGGPRSGDHHWTLAPTVAAVAGRFHSGPFGGLPTRSNTTSGFFHPSSTAVDGVDIDDGKSKRRTRSTSGDSSSDASNGINGSSRNEDQHGNYHWMHVIGGHFFSVVIKLC